MTVIDDKVVSMSFESGKFESGVNSTVSALDRLKASLKLPAATKGLEDVNAAAKRVDLGHIAQGVEDVKNRLSTMRLLAVGVLSEVAGAAIRTGATMVKSFTLGPIIDGFHEYATNLNAVQTILANTQASGSTLKDVNAALNDLNHYSDKTIYNFSEMARNIGTFTAAGVDLKTSTEAIKGIANLAALSGSNSQQASTAMYQLSQAIAAGQVHLQDWNSVVNAGMGGTVFQRALAQTAVAMGTLKESSLKLVGPMKNVSINGESFRQSMQAGPGKASWLNSKVLTTTLKQFTGDLSDAQLKTMGFNDAQIKGIQLQAKTAMQAATQVKTISQVIDVAKETAGSGWAQTWSLIFGNFGEAKITFTALSNAINGFINANSNARNKVLADWKALGGRTILLNSIKTAFHNLGEILKPIKDAFRDIFPATTGQNLLNATKSFERFANALKPSAETVANLHRTFRGLFAVLDIGKQIIMGVFTVFGQLFHAVGGGSGGFLSLTGSIGDFLYSIDQALKKGNRLHNFFVGLGNALAVPMKLLSTFAGILGNLFGSFTTGPLTSSLDGVTKAATPLQKVLTVLARAWDNFTNSIKNSVNTQAIIENIGKSISGIGTAIGHAAAGMNFDVILSAIRTGLFGALVVMFKQFLGRGSLLQQLSRGFSGGLASNISGIFNGLGGAMKSMQNNLRAKTLKEIAIAIALLAASVVALSFVNPQRLNAALGAMTVMFGELIGAMALLDKLSSTGGFLKMPIIVASLTALAVAIDLLTLSVLAMSQLSWNDLLKGLTGVGVLLGGLALAVQPLSAGSAGMVRAGIGITALAVGLRILASAVAAFAVMSWQEIIKGLAGVAVGLRIIAVTMKLMPKNLVSLGAGLVVVAAGLKILASAVADFGAIDWKTMGRGLVGIAGSLVIIAESMKLMPKNMIVTAAGLAIVALSLGRISDAVVKMGGMSIGQIAKGLITLSISLDILASSLVAMGGTLAGAAALGIAAAGIALLAPALRMLGKQSWGEIAKGLIALAGAMAVMGIAGLALAPIAPALLAVGAALVLIGGGLALAGAGIFLVSAGISALAVTGPAGIGILIASLEEFLAAIPKLAASFAQGILSIVQAFSKTAPAFVDAMGKIIDSLLQIIINSAPKIAVAMIALLDAGLKVLADRQGAIIQAGINLVLALLTGIKNNIGKIVTVAVDIVVNFLRSIASNLGRIITAGTQILTSFLQGIANNIGKVVTAGFEIMTKLLTSIVSNYSKLVTAGVNAIVNFVSGMTKNIGSLVAVGTNAIITFVRGVGAAGERIVTAAVTAAGKFITTLASQIVKLSDKVFTAIITLVNGMATVINNRAPELRAAGVNLGIAIINGMSFGLLGKAQELYNQAASIASNVAGKLRGALHIKSPSQVTMEIGGYIIDGLAIGMDRSAPGAYASARVLGNGVINAFQDIFQTHSPSRVMQQIGQYVVQGFAQGLHGSQDQIRSVFTELNNKLTDAMANARETITSEEKKLDDLRKAKKPDADAIKAAQDAIAESELILKRSTASRQILLTQLSSEKKQLIGMVGQYDDLNNRLKTAQDTVKQLIQDRNSFQQGLVDQFSAAPSIPTTDAEGNTLTPAQQLANYMDALRNQSAAVATYKTTLEQLRKLGLDDETYKKLLTEGTADQSFANQLLAGGKTAVQSLNVLDQQLVKVSTALATNAAKNLKQAGIDAAEGLVQGLKDSRSKIRAQMEAIAQDMISALRKELKSKSPSQEFADIGSDSMAGLALGLRNSASGVTRSLTDAARDALNTMRRNLSNLSTAVADTLNPSVVITPVLDLSQVRSQSSELAALTNVSPITAASSYGQASLIAQSELATQLEDTAATPLAGSVVKFEQNNYSPEALSEVEIYRQTRNQLSQLRSALATT